jgi:hypothetical protein
MVNCFEKKIGVGLELVWDLLSLKTNTLETCRRSK